MVPCAGFGLWPAVVLWGDCRSGDGLGWWPGGGLECLVVARCMFGVIVCWWLGDGLAVVVWWWSGGGLGEVKEGGPSTPSG